MIMYSMYCRIQGLLGYKVRFVSVKGVFLSYRDTYRMYRRILQ